MKTRLRYTLSRLLGMILTLWGVLTLVFLLVHLIPGDPLERMLGEEALSADKEALRQALGLHLPLGIQYRDYFLHLFQGEWGRSLYQERQVLSLIAERIPATLELMLGAMSVALALAFPLGLIAASARDRWLDRGISGLAVLGVAIPNFWLGPLLILCFAVWLDWLPVNERGTLAHLILPSLTLGTALAAILTRMIRVSVVEVLQEDYIRTARAKGLPRWRILLKHALPNAFTAVLTVIGLQVGVLLSGAIITETIFDWPGMGSLLLEAIHGRDYPLVQGCVIVIASGYLLVNLLTDLCYGWIDPRLSSPSAHAER